MGNGKGRGLNEGVINTIKSNEKIMGYLKDIESKKIFVGIRNDYFNLYYKGASVAKIEIKNINKKKERIVGTISKKYIFDNNEEENKYPYVEKAIEEIDFDGIIQGIDKYIQDEKNKKKSNDKNVEKECQQNLIMANNSTESNSEWFCIDMEYVMERESSKIPNYGRFDIVAVSKNRDIDSGKYKVALIELKVGTGSFEGTSENLKKLIEEKGVSKGVISVGYDKKLGSGILGHFSDYVRYLEDSTNGYEKLIGEICMILKNYQELELLPESCSIIKDIKNLDFESKPSVVFLTYSGEKQNVDDVKNSFKRYMLNKKVSGHECSKFNVQDMWDEKGKEYISKFKYVFRKGSSDSNVKKPLFPDLTISESINIEE